MKYAVAFINLFDSDLQVKIVDATDDSTWREILMGAFPKYAKFLSPELTLKEAKEDAFSRNWLFEIRGI